MMEEFRREEEEREARVDRSRLTEEQVTGWWAAGGRFRSLHSAIRQVAKMTGWKW